MNKITFSTLKNILITLVSALMLTSCTSDNSSIEKLTIISAKNHSRNQLVNALSPFKDFSVDQNDLHSLMSEYFKFEITGLKKESDTQAVAQVQYLTLHQSILDAIINDLAKKELAARMKNKELSRLISSHVKNSALETPLVKGEKKIYHFNKINKNWIPN